jgi:multidrug efflux pump subunit AcrB
VFDSLGERVNAEWLHGSARPPRERHNTAHVCRQALVAALPLVLVGVTVKRFSLGVSEAGTAVFRLQGPDRESLLAAAEALKSALRAMPGMTDIADDAEGRISRLVVEVDQTRALAAGVTSATIAQALETAYSGGVATVLRQGDILVPVVLRAPEEERLSPEYLLAMPVLGANGPVPLAWRTACVSCLPLKSCARCTPCFSLQARLMMARKASFSGSTASGASVTRSTVRSSTLRAAVTPLSWKLRCEGGASMRWTENTTSSAVKGVPSWNFTPARSWKRQLVGLVICHDVARPDSSLKASLRCTSESWICRTTREW